jgi:hypothetical protein
VEKGGLVLILPVQAALSLEEVARRFTPPSAYPDSVVDRILVIASDRKKVEQEEIPEFFTPTTGKWGMKCEFGHSTQAPDPATTIRRSDSQHKDGANLGMFATRPDQSLCR